MLDTLKLIDATPLPDAVKEELREYRAEGHCFDNFLRYIHFPCWWAIALWYREEKQDRADIDLLQELAYKFSDSPTESELWEIRFWVTRPWGDWRNYFDSDGMPRKPK